MKVDKRDDNLPFLGIHSGLTKLSHYKQTDLREWVGRGAVEREETLERERKKKAKIPMDCVMQTDITLGCLESLQGLSDLCYTLNAKIQ